MAVRLYLAIFTMLIMAGQLDGMHDTVKKPKKTPPSPPGCIRQNSDELQKALLEIALKQGNTQLINELHSIAAQLESKK
jgi:hypothetical protein